MTNGARARDEVFQDGVADASALVFVIDVDGVLNGEAISRPRVERRQRGPATTAPANCSTARETASPRPVGAMRQVRDLWRISALRRGFPAFACVAPLANVRVRSR